jgi:hypothetical protein
MIVANELHETERDALLADLHDRFPRVTFVAYAHGERWGIETDVPPGGAAHIADFSAGWHAGARFVRRVEIG